MITEKELHEAIAECKGKRNPTSETCMKLASYYTILDHLEPSENISTGMNRAGYSFAKQPDYQSDTEFWQTAEAVGIDHTMKVIDELMSTLKMINPRLYNSVLREMEKNA